MINIKFKRLRIIYEEVTAIFNNENENGIFLGYSFLTFFIIFSFQQYPFDLKFCTQCYVTLITLNTKFKVLSIIYEQVTAIIT